MEFEALGELYKVKINGLWGKTDVSFDLYKGCNILSGENGIGKTTALKILESILDFNFIRVAKYRFDSIEFLFDTEEELKFEYADFIVPFPMIEDAFYRVYKKRNQEHKLLRLKFKKMLEYLFETKFIGSVLNSIYEEKYASEVVDIVSKYMPVDLIKPLKNELEILKPIKDEDDYTISVISYAQTHFARSKGAQKVAKGIYTPPIFSDMVNKVKFYYGDESFVKYHYTDRTVDPSKAYKYTFWKCDHESEIETLLSQCEKSELCECIEDKNLCYNGHFIEKLFDDDAEHNAFEVLKAVKEKTGYFDINSIIKSEWHSFDMVCSLNEIALEGANKYYGLIQKNKEYQKEEVLGMLNSLNDEVLYTHKYYCLPVLAEENPFKIDLNRLKNDISVYFDSTMTDDYYVDCLRLLEAYLSVYEILSGVCMDLRIKWTDSSAFESHAKEFIEDKEILVTPAGLNVYVKDNAESNLIMDSDWFLQSAAEERKIPLGKLSSGESKILALTYFILNSHSSILMLY